MKSSEPLICPDTGTEMKICGTARRIVREPGHSFTLWILIAYSEAAKRYHRILPDFLVPNKHYTVNTIKASEEGNEDLDLFDCPSDSTRIRWHRWLSSLTVRSLLYIKSYITDHFTDYRFPSLWSLSLR